MSWLTALFTDTQSPAHAALIYSLVIAAGMALGRIRIRGVSLGVTFVLFTGLVASALGARVDPAVLAFISSFSLSGFRSDRPSSIHSARITAGHSISSRSESSSRGSSSRCSSPRFFPGLCHFLRCSVSTSAR